MKTPVRLLLLTLALLVTVSTSAAAQGRHRTVKRPDAAAASVAGRVTDASTGTPIAEALVRIGTQQALTGTDGTYALTDLKAQGYDLNVSHWRYRTDSRNITLTQGANQLDFALQPAAGATVRMKSGTTYTFTAETVKVGYFVAFVGWRAGPELRLCLPNGQEITIQTSDVKSMTVIGTRTESTSCCSLAPGVALRVTRRSGEVVDATLRESCSGFEFFLLGRNRANGTFENYKLLEVDSVTFE